MILCIFQGLKVGEALLSSEKVQRALLPGEMFEEMMTGGDVVNKGGELLDVKIVDVGVDMAYACSVASAKFEYKGTPNDDVFVLTTIFKKDADGKWKICLAQRSTGRKPDEEPPGPWFTRD